MVKNILKSALAFLGAFFLFAVLANGMNFLLIDSLFAFSGYPRFPATPANPLYVLFPLVFMFFSFPALTLISVQRQFSLKKRFLLLLESHAFFFFGRCFSGALFAFSHCIRLMSFCSFCLDIHQKSTQASPVFSCP